MSVEAILDWNMTSEEGAVFHIALLYEQEYRKFFTDDADGQGFRRNSLPRRGDPRKSNLYRQCWRFRRETRGLIETTEYRNYIRANMFIIKHHKGHVEPNCITGDKAWIRYKVWKRRYDVKMAELNAVAPPPSVSTTDPKIIAEIDKTKKFVFEKCSGEIPTFDKVKQFIDAGMFKLWLATGKISPYYVTLSPFVAKACDVTDLISVCSSSVGVIREKTTQQVKDYFAHEYSYEFA